MQQAQRKDFTFQCPLGEKKIAALSGLTIKPTRSTNFSNLFWNKTVHVSDSSSVYHQEFFTLHTAMVYVIQVC